MTKEIKIQKQWIDGLLKYARRVEESELLKSEKVNDLKRVMPIHGLLGYIDSISEIK